MRLRERLLELIARESLAYSTPDNLFLFLSNSTGEKIDRVKACFYSLLEKGDVFEIRKGKYITVPSHGYTKGKFSGNAKGFGFCLQAGENSDVFIPANKTRGAIDGDEVIVKLYSITQDGSEGEVVSVYKPIKTIVGTVEKLSRNFFVEPDNNHISFKLPIRKSGVRFKESEKVVCRVIRGEHGKISAEVIEVLGDSTDALTLEQAIIRDYNLYEEFPNEVVYTAKKIKQTVTEAQKKNRLDLTNVVTFTIDGEDAKDFDDAVSISRTKIGYKLGVHIADVGEYVKKGSIIDEEAFKRGTSVYFPKTVLPMLPTELSNGICSLNEGVERLTLSCIMNIDKEGNVVSHEIKESVIKSHARLTYNQVHEVLNDAGCKNKAKKFEKELKLMLELSNKLIKNRIAMGSLDLDVPESQFVFNEKGYVVDVKKREIFESHRIIETFMVLANETVAKEYCLKDYPFVYRIHEVPKEDKVRNVCDFLKGIGVKVPQIPEKITPDFIQNLIELTSGESYNETVNKVILRAMQKAKYSPENVGHFGLALTYYCHFTSPIRRYPDLTIHRFIKESLRKKITSVRREEMEDFAEESAIQSSETERNADKAERDVDDLWKAYLMKDRIGEIFEGVITGVNNYGVFVGLDNSVEGLVRVENLPQDNYLFFEKSLMLKGEKQSFKLGDKIKVRLENANIFTRKVDFSCNF